MANKRDYYEVLSVTKTATEGEITKSYRKLAMQFHPDRNVGDVEADIKFKEVGEAYEVLRDPAKRDRYDRYGHAGVTGAAGGGGGFGGGGFGDLADMFSDLLGGMAGGGFGGRRQRAGPRPGRDIQAVLDIDLAEAATGCIKTQTIPREDICKTCSGSGAKPGTKPTTCRRCNGQGAVILNQGFISVQQTCRACDGRGSIITDPCGTCRGNGRVEDRMTLDVEIPAGIDTGNRVRFSGRGDAGEPVAPRGDLEFVIRVRDHKFFRREGHNLGCVWPISFAQAALGGTIEIPTLTGQKVAHELPKGIQTHELIRVPGHGMPNPRGGKKGDLLVQVVVETPTNLTPEQEQLFRKLAELENTHVPGPQKGFFGKLKNLITGDSNPTE